MAKPGPFLDHAAELDMQALCSAASGVRVDAASMHDILRLVRGHVVELQQRLAALQGEAARQRRLEEIFIMEKDCEARLAQSEAASYKFAAEAQAAALATLQA